MEVFVIKGDWNLSKKILDKQSNYFKHQIKRFLKNLHKIGYRYLEFEFKEKNN